jgi:DNA polymerase III epsilon subunit-like protein
MIIKFSLLEEMSRCSVIIKSGSRSGRKCGRIHCPYHTSQEEILQEPVTQEILEPVTQEILEPVTQEITAPIAQEITAPIAQEILEPITQEILQEPIVIPEILLPEEMIESLPTSPIIPDMQLPETTFQLEVVPPSPIARDELLEEEIKTLVRNLIDGVIQNVLKESVEELDDFVEVDEEDCCDQNDTLIIDTETIGLPPHKSVPMTSMDWERCRAVQIAWMKVFSNGKRVNRNYIIRPEGFIVSLTSIHGITHQEAMDKGVPITKVLKQLISDLKSVATVVGHNIDFDYQVVAYEFFRSKLPNKWDSYKKECTMAMGKQYGLCDGPIRLGALYELCFRSAPKQMLHRADADVEVCAMIYEWLNTQNRVYFKVDYKDKDVFKHLNGLWDPEQRKWYTYECHRFLPYLTKWFSRY